MEIIKRDGSKETVKLEKISKRIERQCKDLKNVDAIYIAQKVIQGLYNGVTSVELDKLATETAYSMSVKHPEYDKLATRLAISALHKETESTFTAVIEKLYAVKSANGENRPMIADNVLKFIRKNSAVLDSTIDYNRDYLFDYFGFKTLERSYLMKVDGKIVERPQHMWMRVACGIHYDDIDAALNTYHLLSTLKATHATPTLFNAGTPKNQLSSCFLVAMKDDSIAGIYDTIKEMALISQSAGGLGLHIHNVRSKGSPIYGTGGTSNGLTPCLQVVNSTLRYVDQCFVGETPIKTKDGFKPIKDITTNDSVLTSDGSYKEVIQKKSFNKKEREMIRIVTQSGENYVTDNHLFLVLKNGKNIENIRQKIKLGLVKAKWIIAKEIDQNDYLISLK